MTDNEKKLQVDDDWKAEARREKERLEREAAPPETTPDAGFMGLVDMVAMQAIVSLGGYAGPGGESIPPNPGAAKHFIDMLQVLEDKTRNNLTPEEKRHLDTVLYEVRMSYVQLTARGAGAAPRT